MNPTQRKHLKIVAIVLALFFGIPMTVIYIQIKIQEAKVRAIAEEDFPPVQRSTESYLPPEPFFPEAPTPQEIKIEQARQAVRDAEAEMRAAEARLKGRIPGL